MIILKFIILTTGLQIKLYPLAPSEPSERQSQQLGVGGDLKDYAVSQQSWYLIKPDTEWRWSNLTEGKRKLFSKTAGNLGKWLVAKGHAEENKRRKNILPGGDQSLEQMEFDNYGTDWKQPLISDVDYFFNRKFCRHDSHDQDCLVIFWLDKINNNIRYGSVDLKKNPITLINSDRTKKARDSSNGRALWLNEFPPVTPNVLRHGEEDVIYSGPHVHMSAMAVDRDRSRLHVAVRDNDRAMTNQLVSGNILPWFTDNEYSHTSKLLVNRTALAFNLCSKESTVNNPILEDSTFKNLHLDEASGKWMFYLNQQQDSTIFALNLEKQEVVHEYGQWYRPSLHSCPSCTGAQAKVRRINEESDSKEDAMAMAMDSQTRRLYWLNKDHQIFKCDYNGDNVKLVATLSSKPVIKSSDTMQVFQDTLFISDPVKKSLIAFKLVQEDVGDEDEEQTSTQSPAIRNANNDTQTHQVWLVDYPTVYGFRLVQMKQPKISRRANGDSGDGISAENVERYPDEEEVVRLTGNEKATEEAYRKLLTKATTCAEQEVGASKKIENVQESFKNDVYFQIFLSVAIRALFIVSFFTALLSILIAIKRYQNPNQPTPLKEESAA